MYAIQLHKTSQINDQNTDIVFANHLKWHSDGMKRVFNIIMSNMVVCQKQQQNVFKINLCSSVYWGLTRSGEMLWHLGKTTPQDE